MHLSSASTLRKFDIKHVPHNCEMPQDARAFANLRMCMQGQSQYLMFSGSWALLAELEYQPSDPPKGEKGTPWNPHLQGAAHRPDGQLKLDINDSTIIPTPEP